MTATGCDSGFIADTERRSQVIEHISTAVARPRKAVRQIARSLLCRSGASMVATGYSATAGGAGITTCPVDHHYTAVMVRWVLAPHVAADACRYLDADRRVADIMLMSAIMPVTVAAARPSPRPGGAPPQAVLGWSADRRCGPGLSVVHRSPPKGFTPHRHHRCADNACSLGVRMVAATRGDALLGRPCVVDLRSVAYHAPWHCLGGRRHPTAGVRPPPAGGSEARVAFDLPTTVVVSGGAHRSWKRAVIGA